MTFILSNAMSITFFDDEIDHEVKLPKETSIVTCIQSHIVQGSGGAFSPNSRILWSNRSAMEEQLWKLVNVVQPCHRRKDYGRGLPSLSKQQKPVITVYPFRHAFAPELPRRAHGRWRNPLRLRPLRPQQEFEWRFVLDKLRDYTDGILGTNQYLAKLVLIISLDSALKLPNLL